jgi:hypothetical protein
MGRYLMLCLLVCATGCNPPTTSESPKPSSTSPAAAAQASEADTHQAAKDYLLDNANDPKSVEFSRWGPDDLSGKTIAAYAKAKKVPFVNGSLLVGDLGIPNGGDIFAKADQIVRVRYRAKNAAGALQLSDLLVGLKAGKVTGTLENSLGDEWLDKLTEKFTKNQEKKAVSWEQYDQIKEGAPASEVQKIMGEEPSVTVTLDNKRVVGWKADDDIIVVQFRKDKAVEKSAQIGKENKKGW